MDGNKTENIRHLEKIPASKFIRLYILEKFQSMKSDVSLPDNHKYFITASHFCIFRLDKFGRFFTHKDITIQ